MRNKLVALVVCISAVVPSFCLQGLVNDQKPMLSIASTPSRNYSIGFSLASSYGAAAVIIDDANDEKKTLTWVVQGDSAYREVTARLSLESSQHIA